LRSSKRTAARLGLLVVAAALLVLPMASLAANPTTLQARGAELGAAEQQARLDLFALESRLQRARTTLSGLEARLSALERERSSSRRQLAVARRTLAAAEQRLADQVRALYVLEEPDALSIFLGAASIEDALDNVDSLQRSADATSGVLDEARAARARVVTLLHRQTTRRAELRQLRAVAFTRARELAGAQAGRIAYIGQLRAERVLNDQQIAEAIAAAESAQAAATVQTAIAATSPSVSSIGGQTVVQTPQPQPSPEPQPAAQAPAGPNGRTLTVVATAYTLRGTTATGIPVGPGIVAVDPTVIPLGTRMTIPGYGEAVAADTGGAIKGLRIDVWVATAAEAAQWQWRTVTITLH
jgi:3D (Asp-Asp-Asp) domain-containing protein